ncbi:MAG: hypothetical protein PHY48_00550 [Candidatus Cloacimonetes bacterium]|nr:hypothetical protein [Candidatus Cloacimonadota bacterium]
MDEYYKTTDSGDSHFGTVDTSIAPVMSMLEWLVIIIISCIPVANIVVMFIWAFGNNDNPNRRNFAKAFLILTGIGMLISAIFMGQVIGMMMKATTMF